MIRMIKKRKRMNRKPLRPSKRLLRTRRNMRSRPRSRGSSKRSNRRSRVPVHLQHDFAAGISDGAAWRGNGPPDSNVEGFRETIHQRINDRFKETNRKKGADWKHVLQRSGKYAAGFMKGAGISTTISPVPLENKAAAVVYVGPQSSRLNDVLAQLDKLPFQEIILVLSNPTEAVYSLAKNRKNTVIAYFPEELDPDVGRALGSKLTKADTLLFVDGEQVVDANILARFLWECDGRFDIALNDNTARTGLFHKRGNILWLHEFLNASLNREDLLTNSMSVLPFAITRQALEKLGPSTLAIPVKAHANAILSGLKIGVAGSAGNQAGHVNSEGNWKKAAGDHMEAWSDAMSMRGSRLQFEDTTRNRGLLEGGKS